MTPYHTISDHSDDEFSYHTNNHHMSISYYMNNSFQNMIANDSNPIGFLADYPVCFGMSV